MRGRRSAAAADDLHPEIANEFREGRRHRPWLQWIDRFADAGVERQPRVRNHRQRQCCVLGQVPHRFAHVLGPGGAVQSNDVDLERLERRHGAGDVGAQQHAPADVERDLGLDRKAPSDLREELLNSRDRCLHLEDVLRSLDQQQIDTALDQILRLLVVVGGQLLVGDLGQHRIGAGRQHPGGAHGRRDESRPIGRLELAARRSRNSRGRNVDVANFVAESPLVEATRRRLERTGLDDVAANGEKRLVDFLDDVGARQHEVIVAPFQRLSTEVLGRKIVALDVRPHRAVVHEHAALHLIQVTRLDLLVGHTLSARRSLCCGLSTKKPARKRRASALAVCLTWPQVALNRHEFCCTLHYSSAE